MRHEAADAESAYPMPLAMSCSFPTTGGAWRQLPRHKHRAKGVLLGNSSEANRSGERREKVVKVASLSTLEVSTEMNRGMSIPPLWLTYHWAFLETRTRRRVLECPSRAHAYSYGVIITTSPSASRHSGTCNRPKVPFQPPIYCPYNG